MREGDLHVRVTTHGDDEIARLGDAFNAMAERLDQTERLKRQMVTDVAHELRSPVTNLRCGLEAIQDGLAAPDRDRIDALHRDTLLLQRLISDLQDLALADAGGLAIARQPVDVATVIRRAIGAVDGGPPIAVSVDPHAARVSADEGRVEQMLRNLIDNARRHTRPTGGSTSRPHAPAPRSRSPSPTPGAASPPNICRTSSTASTAPINPARARPAVRDSASRSSGGLRRRTAGV